ncbi:hypothetical protein JW899_00825 [Candidatus Uhrbacteria bacterium]|nr:hypothetical protein [Candidatus Uhrbacteria bacterium]
MKRTTVIWAVMAIAIGCGGGHARFESRVGDSEIHGHAHNPEGMAYTIGETQIKQESLRRCWAARENGDTGVICPGDRGYGHYGMGDEAGFYGYGGYGSGSGRIDRNQARDGHDMPNPPQNMSWLNSEPTACQNTPLHMRIHNPTNFSVRLMLDGEPVEVRGGQGALPYMPPKSVIHLCLNKPGRHVVAGVAYTVREPVPVEMLRFSFEIKTGEAQLGYHEWLDWRLIRRHQVH